MYENENLLIVVRRINLHLWYDLQKKMIQQIHLLFCLTLFLCNIPTAKSIKDIFNFKASYANN